ncbi:MAG: hypothetical protein FWF63_02700 [Fibromonadales bacterium]|nr:hypothetical protein [Fibromonadales bacterium]
MNKSIKILAYAIVASIAFFACDDTSTNNTEPDCSKIPIMDSRVVSYQHKGCSKDYNYTFIDDDELLKSCFPHIFNNGQAESKCNYFALNFVSSSDAWYMGYIVLSKDMTLHYMTCSGHPGGVNGDFAYVSMLVCGDKDGKLRKSINFDSIQNYEILNWDCESGTGMPNWEEIYF